MSTTPPRAMRLRTPPAPHHGPDYDNYEPYSPIRRSTRNSSLRTRQQSPTAESSSTARLSMTSTPRKTTLSRTMSSQTLSPPSSPEPAERHAEEPTSVRRTLFSSRKHLPLSASDNQDFKSSPAMLPTPTKTPSKQNATASMPTARILNFKPASLEDVMPSARRQRKSRLTLFEDDAPQAESISVFTDAQDRVPDMDPSEDNPFIGSRKREPKPTKKAMLAARDREAEMEEAVRNEEGLIYVFRGKRIFRPFASSSRDTSDHDSAASEQGQLKRKAGHGAHRPITRSAVKPRLLWPSKEQLHEDEPSHTAHDDDEEADTDIEQEHMPRPMPQADKDLVTPAKKMFAPVDMLTPPSTHRATRSAAKKLSFMSQFDPIPERDEIETPASPAATPVVKASRKKTSLFENWKRTKPGVPDLDSTKHGKKRAADPLHPAEEPSRKRTRGEAAESEHA